MSATVRVAVKDSSQPGEARRIAVAIAEKLGFDEVAAGKVAIVVTEGATNLVKHGRGGEILLQHIRANGATGLEIIVIDRGDGIVDISRSFRDGESTSGSSGSGLGAIARLSASHDLYSRPGLGTALLARLWPSQEPRRIPTSIEVEGISVPLAGETVCGDDWAVRHSARGCSILVADGLGHGVSASDAAREAVQAFLQCPADSAANCMEAIHARLRSTRGAAAAIATIDTVAGNVRFVGIGNIAGVVADTDGTKSMVSMSGTLGHTVRVVREFNYSWRRTSRLIMHSDGLSGRWDLGSYPGLLQCQPALAAAVLYRDMARGNDDATVVVARQSGEVS